MYEPIRTKSVHTMAGTTSSDFPHRSREEELDIQLAGHLAALLAATDELRALTPPTTSTRRRRRWPRGSPGCGAAFRRYAPLRAEARRMSPRSTGAHTPSRGGPWSSRRPARTRRPRSWRPSGWTRTPASR